MPIGPTILITQNGLWSTTSQHLKEISEETEKSIGTSALLENWAPTSPDEEYQPVAGISEDTVNASSVSLLSEICLSLKSPLKWILDKPKFKLCKNKANIVAVTDGQLRGDSGDLKFPYAIVEVKPYSLRSHHFESSQWGTTGIFSPCDPMNITFIFP